MTRERTPDLLESMFNPLVEEASPPVAPPPRTPSRRATPAKSTPNKPVDKPAAKSKAATQERSPELSIRCTHYLSRDTASRLPIAQGQLLMLTALQKRDVSNSNIVEAALRLAFADLEKNGTKSQLLTLLRDLADA